MRTLIVAALLMGSGGVSAHDDPEWEEFVQRREAEFHREVELRFFTRGARLTPHALASIGRTCGLRTRLRAHASTRDAGFRRERFELEVDGHDVGGLHCAVDAVLRFGAVSLDLLEARRAGGAVMGRLVVTQLQMPEDIGELPMPGYLPTPYANRLSPQPGAGAPADAGPVLEADLENSPLAALLAETLEDLDETPAPRPAPPLDRMSIDFDQIAARTGGARWRMDMHAAPIWQALLLDVVRDAGLDDLSVSLTPTRVQIAGRAKDAATRASLARFHWPRDVEVVVDVAVAPMSR